MSSMRRRLIIILIVALILIIPTVLVLIVVNRSPRLQNAILSTAHQTRTNSNVPVNTNTPTPVKSNPDRATIEYVARNFSEVYGSGTNQNQAANYLQAKQWGTPDFNRFLDRTIAQERAQATTPFRGTVSRALVLDVTRQTATVASVTVSLDRQETIDTTRRAYTQDLYLDLIKQGNDWRINAAAWQAL